MGKGHFSFARLFLVAFLVFIAACQASAEQRRPARRGGGVASRSRRHPDICCRAPVLVLMGAACPWARPPPPALSRQPRRPPRHGGCCGPGAGGGGAGSPGAPRQERRNLCAAERVPRGGEQRRTALGRGTGEPGGPGSAAGGGGWGGEAVAGAGPAGPGQAAMYAGLQELGVANGEDLKETLTNCTEPLKAIEQFQVRRVATEVRGWRGPPVRGRGCGEHEKARSGACVFWGFRLFLFFNQHGFSCPRCRLLASGAG